MPTLWEDLKTKLEALATGWASYVALGSFALYLLGYLATRFHLTALGVGTDLSVLDEHYLFAGAKFLVYLFSTSTHVLLFAVLALLLYGLYLLAARLTPGLRRPGSWLWGKAARLGRWLDGAWGTPVRLALVGIAFSVLFIQIVMRKCYDFANLLLASELPDTQVGLENLLLADGKSKACYFAVLMLATALVFLLLYLAKSRLGASQPGAPLARFLVGLLAFLAAVQLLLLPVNYGVFIMDKHLARVSDLGDEKALDPCQTGAWLVWEGAEGVTYLVAEPHPPPAAAQPTPPAAPAPETQAAQGGVITEQAKKSCINEAPLLGLKRSLVTVPRKDVKRWQIVDYDQIFRRIFVKKQAP